MSKFLTNILNSQPGEKTSDHETPVTGVTPVAPVTSAAPQRKRSKNDRTQVTPVTPVTEVRQDTPVTLDTPDTPVTPPTGVTGVTPVRPVKDPERRFAVSPTSDYQKYPNANIRDAIAAGAFPGKSKVLYDVLWDHSRGAIKPSRTVIIGKPKLMKLADIGSKFTLEKYLNHFQQKGLLRIKKRDSGEHGGNEYEVFIWGEQQTGITGVTPVTDGNPGNPGTSMGGEPPSFSAPGHSGLSADNIGLSRYPKTLFKDSLNPDDEKPLIEALEKFAADAKMLTGREPNARYYSDIANMLNMISDEIRKAGEKTSVTDYGKFATEHVRRLLVKRSVNPPKDTKPFFDPGREVVLDESAVDVVDITPEPLDEEQKEIKLQSLRQMVERNGVEHIEVYRTNFTEDDWTWLMQNLEAGE